METNNSTPAEGGVESVASSINPKDVMTRLAIYAADTEAGEIVAQAQEAVAAMDDSDTMKTDFNQVPEGENFRI